MTGQRTKRIKPKQATNLLNCQILTGQHAYNLLWASASQITPILNQQAPCISVYFTL